MQLMDRVPDLLEKEASAAKEKEPTELKEKEAPAVKGKEAPALKEKEASAIQRKGGSGSSKIRRLQKDLWCAKTNTCGFFGGFEIIADRFGLYLVSELDVLLEVR